MKISEWLVNSTTPAQRRQVNFWLLVFWLIPGFVIWFVLRDSLAFVGFMSIYAIWVSHWSAFSSETPVEEEGE